MAEVFVESWGAYGSGAGKMLEPAFLDAYDGELYIPDAVGIGGEVSVFEFDGTYQRQWSTANAPYAAKQYGGEVYVTLWNVDHMVKVYSTAGVLQRSWGSFGTGDNQFEGPSGIFVYGDEVYVANSGYGTNRPYVKVYDTAGTFQRKWGAYGTGDGQMKYPHGIFVYGGEVYVTEREGSRVQVFDLSGNYQRKWGTDGLGNGQFKAPSGILVYNGRHAEVRLVHDLPGVDDAPPVLGGPAGVLLPGRHRLRAQPEARFLLRPGEGGLGPLRESI